MHCNQYVSRTRERAHRKQQLAPLYSPPRRIPSRLRRVFDVEEISEHETAADGTGVSTGTGIDDCESRAPVIKAVEQMILDRWNLEARSDEEDSESSTSTPVDDDDEGDFDYELFESELSAWDQLGEGYERDAANIGGSRDRTKVRVTHALIFSRKVERL